MIDERTSGRADRQIAAQAVRGILEERGFGTARTASVVHCVEAHRFRDATIKPQTLEAMCVYDADKLDSIGAIGVGRAV